MITRKIKKTIYNALVICLLLIGLVYVCSRFIHPGVEYTDNAQVRQHITPVNTRVQGFIREIRFEEYSPVRRGTLPMPVQWKQPPPPARRLPGITSA